MTQRSDYGTHIMMKNATRGQRNEILYKDWNVLFYFVFTMICL